MQPYSEQQVYDSVCTYLSDGESISLTPVRQAIAVLASDGLLKVVPHVGTFVRHLKYQEVKEIQRSRIIIECYCVRKVACLVASGSTQFALRDGLLSEPFPRHLSVMDFVNADFAFHQKLIDASGFRATYGRFLDSLKSRFILIAIPNALKFSKKSAKEHLEIVRAIEKGDSHLAAKAMRNHLWNSVKRWRKNQ